MTQRRAVVMGNVEGGPRIAAEATDCRSNQSAERRLQRLAVHCSLECFILAALPLFRLFGKYALGNVDIVPDHTHDAAVLVVISLPPAGDPSNLAGWTNDSEVNVERFVVENTGIALEFRPG